MRHQIIAAGLAVTFAFAADQKPGAAEQRRALDAARDMALTYASKLPDFICTEEVVRRDYVSPTSQKTDRLVLDLGYSDRKEKQKLVTLNGSPATKTLEQLSGLITGGEFGSLQLAVFAPQSQADLAWKESSTLRKRKVAVYTYKIARAHSHYLVGRRAENGQIVDEAAGYHGDISLDETGRVLRLTATADDIPGDTGIVQSSVDIDYDFVSVAGKTYLLPLHSESRMVRGLRKISNEVKFTNYRKFQAESTIDFK